MKRPVRHTLLIHHNLTSALFLDDLLDMFNSKGWQLIDAINAFVPDDPPEPLWYCVEYSVAKKVEDDKDLLVTRMMEAQSASDAFKDLLQDAGAKKIRQYTEVKRG